MNDYLVFDDINSADYSIYIADKNQFDAPARDVEVIAVPGLNGTLTIDNGRFENVSLTYLLYIRKDMVRNVSAFRERLLQKSGYKRLQDSFNPDEFYLARLTDEFTVEQSDRYRAGFEVKFDRKPQRYLISGIKPVTISNPTTIKNPTMCEAKPLIRAYGTGTLDINGITLKVTSASGYTDINCEIQEAYRDNVNCNGNITLNNNVFPTLSAGNNTITYSGFSKVELTPNWWTV